MTKRVLLVTVGTLGDLYPFIAMGLALRTRGLQPVLAVPEDQVDRCRAAGLEAAAVLPGFDAVCQTMGLEHAEAVRRLLNSQRLMMDQVLMTGLADCVAALDRLADGADAVVGSIFAFAAAIVAEKHRLPLVSVILQPMAMLSALDPPATADFRIMRPVPVGRIGTAWNRCVYAVLRQILHALYGRKVDRVRVAYGLPRAGARRLLEPAQTAVLRLGCYSPALAPLPRDVQRDTRLVGFPMFDHAGVCGEPLPDLLQAFLTAGSLPLVFTLGTFAVASAGNFYDLAQEAATRLKRRAVLLIGGNAPPRWSGDIFVCGYARHSQLFPAAAAIVHHGGVGTTGQAMRAGKPQLVIPHMGDQNDHAARIVRLGLGSRLSRSRLTSHSLEKALMRLLQNPAYAGRAEAVAARMAAENGAVAAADAIIEALASSQ